MLSSTARSSSAPAVRRAYIEPSRRAVHSSTRLLQFSSIPLVHSSRSQQSCTILVFRSQPFSTSSTYSSTRRSRRVHREALDRANASLTGRIPAFTGSPPAANPAALRLAAKARLERLAAGHNPPEFLDYEPQRNKASSVFFWSDEANDMDRKLMARGNYPPPLPKFKHGDNQQISKCHPSVWLASAHHLQMMHEGYDRLAFMGDAVAGKCLSDMLLNDYYCIAGTMGLLKARLVSNAQFAYFSRIYNIPCKKDENAQGDAFEALIGALYLDGKRDGADVDRIIYNWLKELSDPWLQLYISQLSPSQKDRVVSLHRAVPIAIAVATSNNPNSSQVMMAWESNIATQMIERRLKRGQEEKNLLQPAVAPVALEGPTVDTVGTSHVSPEYAGAIEPAEEEEIVEEEEETVVEEEELVEEEVEEPVEEEEAAEYMKVRQVTAAVTSKAWPTAMSTLKDQIAENRKELEAVLEAERKAEQERIRDETEALRKANEERRQREMGRRKEAVQKEALRLAEVKRKQEEEARRRDDDARRREEAYRLEVQVLEERLSRQLETAKKEADNAKRKADQEVEIARKKLEQSRPVTKAEKRALKKAAQLELEMQKLTEKKRQLEAAAKARYERENAGKEEEREKAEAEKAEQEKIEKEKAEKEKAEKEKVEKEKVEKEKAEKEKAEKEKIEKEKIEKERAEKERAEKKRAEKEKAEKEKAEKEKAEKEKAEKEKMEKEKAEKEKAAKEKAEKEKAEKEKAEKEKAEKEKAEKEKAEKGKAEKRKAEKEKAQAQAEKEKAEKEKAEKEKAKHEAEKAKVEKEKLEKAEEPAKVTPEPLKPQTTKPSKPEKPSPEKIEALIREKEALRTAKLREEEEALKLQRLLHDIREMKELVKQRMEQTFKNSPYMTDEQKREFTNGWKQYASIQREKMEKDAGVEVGSTLKHGKGEEEEKVEKVEEEEKGIFGRLWGRIRGKK